MLLLSVFDLRLEHILGHRHICPWGFTLFIHPFRILWVCETCNISFHCVQLNCLFMYEHRKRVLPNLPVAALSQWWVVFSLSILSWGHNFSMANDWSVNLMPSWDLATDGLSNVYSSLGVKRYIVTHSSDIQADHTVISANECYDCCFENRLKLYNFIKVH